MRPTLTPMQTMMLVRLHLSAGPIPDDEWTTDEWPEVRRLREAGLAEHHHGFASTAPDGAAIAQRAIDALAAWEHGRKLVERHLREHGPVKLERAPMTEDERAAMIAEVFGGR